MYDLGAYYHAVSCKISLIYTPRKRLNPTFCFVDATPVCKHLCVLESVAKVQPVINNLSLKCNNTNIGSNEAIPMTCCGLGRQDTWLKGIKVLLYYRLFLCSTPTWRLSFVHPFFCVLYGILSLWVLGEEGFWNVFSLKFCCYLYSKYMSE